MYSGRCPSCGENYRGWALGNPQLHICSKCEKPLIITEDNEYMSVGFNDSLFKNRQAIWTSRDAGHSIGYVFERLFKQNS